MRVLVLGCTGMLGHKLYQQLSGSAETWATVRGEPQSLQRFGFYCPDRIIGSVDARHPETVRRAIDLSRPDWVVNCVGIVKQLPAGKQPIPCISVNSLFPHLVSEMCANAGARFVHISTDCVFSGVKGGYTEDDPTDAEDLYGRSKALGEVTDKHAITLRTSIIGRELSSQLGLVEWFLAQSGCVRGFTEAYFSGLTTLELAKVIERTILDPRDLSGVYQVSAARIDKYSLLELLRGALGHEIEIVRDGTVKIDRSLNSARFRTATGYEPPGWEEMISAMTADPTCYGKRVGK